MRSVGVDIGGTFTDVVVYDPATAGLLEAKTLSTPDDPATAIIDGLAKCGVALAEVGRFVHGTTRVTNSLLEGAGEPVSVLTTAGFRDVLEMGRGHRPRLYSVKESARPALTPRRRRHVVRERIGSDGSVLVPLDDDDLDAAIEALAHDDPRAIAVCLLHSVRNPSHERAVALRLAQRLPRAVVTISSDVVPEQGEYERFATTVLNAGVRGPVSNYLHGLGVALAEQGYTHPLSIMTSSGGVVSTDEAGRSPINLALSGPAGGVAAAVHVAGRAGYANVLTCDIGGTSTDVCLIKDGAPLMTSDASIAGHPNRTFQIEINTIGAGGGSIAFRDVGGELRIGPRSAGSQPGPAAYGRGGTEPTTTDAHLVVGHLAPDASLGGEVRLDLDAARSAMRRVADHFGLDELKLARGILRLATVKMTSAIKEISIARGHDPREFVLMPYGGAGPMHATALADELGVTRVLVPPVPGNFSALGFVTAQVRHDHVRTVLNDADDEGLAATRLSLAELRHSALEQIETEDGIRPQDATFDLSLGMRFRGQSFTVDVPFDTLPEAGEQLRTRFHEVYARRYAYVRADQPSEIVTIRLTAFGPRPPVDLPAPSTRGARPTPTRCYGAGGWVDATAWERGDLTLEQVVTGPAVVRESGATTVVGAGWQGSPDAYGNLLLTRSAT